MFGIKQLSEDREYALYERCVAECQDDLLYAIRENPQPFLSDYLGLDIFEDAEYLSIIEEWADTARESGMDRAMVTLPNSHKVCFDKFTAMLARKVDEAWEYYAGRV